MPVKKEMILQEIRRLAKASDGIAPGVERFESLTGIPPSTWRGRHWENWSEALSEAGFAPNKLISALPEEALLEALAKLAREKGKIPTNVQLRMKAFKEAGFPAHTTFDNRLGTKTEKISKLLAFCRNHPEYADIVAICEKTLPLQSELSENSSNDSDSIGDAYVIFSSLDAVINSVSQTTTNDAFVNSPIRRRNQLAPFIPSALMILAVSKPTGKDASPINASTMSGLS